MISIAIDTTSTPTTIYGYDGYNGGIDKSTDGGNTWTLVDGYGGPPLSVDSSASPSILYYGPGPIIKSTDGGATLKQIWSSDTTVSVMALDAATAGPASPSTLYIANSQSFSAFVAELNPTGSALLFSTYLGGIEANTFGNAIVLDAVDNIYIAGRTTSLFLPTVNAYQTGLSLPTQTGDSPFNP
jgi:hypothetical protein